MQARNGNRKHHKKQQPDQSERALQPWEDCCDDCGAVYDMRKGGGFCYRCASEAAKGRRNRTEAREASWET